MKTGKESSRSKESFLLFDCCSDRVKDIQKFLEENPDIDITYRDGQFFGLAIVADSGSPEMLELLIDYYHRTRMQGDPKSAEYKLAKERLLDILSDESDMENIAPQIRAVLDKHLNEGESDRENDFEGFEGLSDLEDDGTSYEQESAASTHDSGSYLPLTEENLRMLSRTNSMSIDEHSAVDNITPKTKSLGYIPDNLNNPNLAPDAITQIVAPLSALAIETKALDSSNILTSDGLTALGLDNG